MIRKRNNNKIGTQGAISTLHVLGVSMINVTKQEAAKTGDSAKGCAM